MLTERDYVMRHVRQLVEAIARALRLAGAKDLTAARETLERACSADLGMEWRVLSLLDAPTVVDLLGGPARASAFAELVEAMAEVERRAGDAGRAERLRRHARLLTWELLERWPTHVAALALQERLARPGGA